MLTEPKAYRTLAAAVAAILAVNMVRLVYFSDKPDNATHTRVDRLWLMCLMCRCLSHMLC